MKDEPRRKKIAWKWINGDYVKYEYLVRDFDISDRIEHRFRFANGSTGEYDEWFKKCFNV